MLSAFLNIFYFVYSDFGLHIDGFIATAAHTLVVGATKDEPVTGKKADALKAAHYAAEASIRLIQSGNKVCYRHIAYLVICKRFCSIYAFSAP